MKKKKIIIKIALDTPTENLIKDFTQVVIKTFHSTVLLLVK